MNSKVLTEQNTTFNVPQIARNAVVRKGSTGFSPEYVTNKNKRKRVKSHLQKVSRQKNRQK